MTTKVIECVKEDSWIEKNTFSRIVGVEIAVGHSGVTLFPVLPKIKAKIGMCLVLNRKAAINLALAILDLCFPDGWSIAPMGGKVRKTKNESREFVFWDDANRSWLLEEQPK